jgi:hypothetical protein
MQNNYFLTGNKIIELTVNNTLQITARIIFTIFEL